MPRPFKIEDLGDKRFRAHFATGTVEFTQTRERSYSGVNDSFSCDEVHANAYRHAIQFLKRGGRVLDYGCGSGYGTDILSNAGFTVDGLDSSPSAIMFATHRAFPAHMYLVPRDSKAAKPGYASVICVEVIEHIENDVAAICDMHVSLNAGGILYLTTPLADATQGMSEYHVREYTREQLVALLEPCFKDIVFRDLHGCPETLCITAVSR